jgi:hypothetical protein
MKKCVQATVEDPGCSCTTWPGGASQTVPMLPLTIAAGAAEVPIQLDAARLAAGCADSSVLHALGAVPLGIQGQQRCRRRLAAGGSCKEYSITLSMQCYTAVSGVCLLASCRTLLTAVNSPGMHTQERP